MKREDFGGVEICNSISLCVGNCNINCLLSQQCQHGKCYWDFECLSVKVYGEMEEDRVEKSRRTA